MSCPRNSRGKKSAETITIKPGVYADFDKDGRLIGIEVIDAKELMGEKIEFKGVMRGQTFCSRQRKWSLSLFCTSVSLGSVNYVLNVVKGLLKVVGRVPL